MAKTSPVAMPGPGTVATAPDGEAFALPSAEAEAARFTEIERAAEGHRERGGSVVVVQGLGFVGAAVAAVIASATDSAGSPHHFVIGLDLPTPEGFWKVARLNRGESPAGSTDDRLGPLTRASVERGNLVATSCEAAHTLADVIVVDVHLDVHTRVAETPADIEINLQAFDEAIRSVGRHMRSDALVVIETTVPLGMCARFVRPALDEERRRRGIEAPVLLAHAYERVMPGPRYVESIREYPRTFAGIDEASTARARKFLATFIDVDNYPLWELPDTTSSELAKLLENSYRSMNIGFMQEWTLLAECVGVNLFDVVESVRVRTGTHDNMRYPGFGVGGYCLTKDSLLAQWAATNLFDSDTVLTMTLDALKTNFLMPLHTCDLLRELLGDIAGRTVAVLGVSYLPDVPDTRNSPTEMLLDALEQAGAKVRLHDPLILRWPERPDAEVWTDLGAALQGVDAVVFAVPHREYVELSAGGLLGLLGRSVSVVDGHNAISDERAAALVEAGCRVIGVGKGHWRRRGYDSA